MDEKQGVVDTLSSTGAEVLTFTVTGESVISGYKDWLKKTYVRVLYATLMLHKEGQIVSASKILKKVEELFHKRYTNKEFHEIISAINTKNRTLIVSGVVSEVKVYFLTELGMRFISALRNDPKESCKFEKSSTPNLPFKAKKLRTA